MIKLAPRPLEGVVISDVLYEQLTQSAQWFNSLGYIGNDVVKIFCLRIGPRSP